MKKLLNSLFILFAFMALFSSCVSLTGFQEGRSLGNGNSEFMASGNFTRVPDLFNDDDDVFSDTLDTSISFPNVELSYMRGVTDKLDIGGRISSNLSFTAFGKYQVVGDNTSQFALSPGLEVGSILGLAYNVGIPIHATYYPTESIAINLTPRYIYQFISGSENDGVSYLGGNFGLSFGKRHKFGIDVGYYGVNSENLDAQSLITFGIGGKFRFGDFDTTSTGKKKKKKKKKRRKRR